MKNQIISAAAKKLYQDSLVVDLQLGFEPEIEATYKWDVLNRFYQAGFSLASLAMSTDHTSLDNTINYIANVRAKISQQSDKYVLVDTVADIQHAKNQNKTAITLLMQGANPLVKNLNMLDIYYKLGVRSMILAYNIRNPFADGCAEPSDAGLSRLGGQLIEKMNDVGMVIDLSHTGYTSSMQAMESSQKPVLFSHSNVYALKPHPRNLKDDQIKALAKNGGVIGINGNGGLLSDTDATAQKFVEHIDYISQLIGSQFVAIGTDWVYFPELFSDYMERNSIFYSADYRQGIENKVLTSIVPEQMIEIVELLLQRGYSENNIRDILGGNYMRLVEKVWK